MYFRAIPKARIPFSANMRRLGWLAVAMLPVLLLSVTSLRASSAADDENLSPAARRGEGIFKQRCIVCHNKQPGDTTPFGPPNLNGIFRGPNPVTTKEATDIIVNGKTTMPGWGKILTKGDVDDLIAYLKTK
jgi:mono/diheme cytochrome c family protein